MYLKKIIVLFLTQVSLSLQAQTIQHEKLDSISTEISNLQLKANNLPYKDAKGNEYEISFSDNNFEILFYHKTHLIYRCVFGETLFPNGIFKNTAF